MRMLSRGILKKAKSRSVDYSFLFMRAQGQQLSEIAKLIDAGAIRPVVDKVFPLRRRLTPWLMSKPGAPRGRLLLPLHNDRLASRQVVLFEG